MTSSDVRDASPESGLLLSAGRVLASADDGDFYRRVTAVLGAFLQVKNLSVLLGAGASYPLGSPRIRGMTLTAIDEMLERAVLEPASETHELIAQLVEHAGGSVDLEQLLSTLGAALAIAGGTEEIEFAGLSTSVEGLTDARRALNRALALDCDLPKPDVELSEPLRAHRTFFRRLLRARRLDLPRVRLFTTNYDLVIEKALDQDGVVYFDGFSGTVERVFRPEMFDRDLYLPPDPDQRRMLRVPDLLYLHKLHGSINWRSRRGAELIGADAVVQAPGFGASADEELVLIFPTPLKEGDVLAYPYSVLFRTFMTALSETDSALLVIGYGFGDDHINRQILQALGSPSFQLLVVVPSGVVGSCVRADEGIGCEFLDGALGALGGSADARITVLTGSVAGRFEDLAFRSMPDSAEAGENMPSETQASLAEHLLEST